jgi:2-dehydrotetronate isomerase
MPRFAANLTTLFTELPLTERFAAAARSGFKGVEILFPYDDPAPVLQDLIAQNGLSLVLINAPPPNYTDRPRGFAAIPGGEAGFRQDFTRALRVARALGAQHLHLMAGVASGPPARATMVTNLRWAAAQAPGQSLTIEPINPVDMPGYFLNDYDLALGILQDVAAPNLHLQFDAYHAHRVTGDVLGTWARCRAQVAHVQIAGYPGRHEPMGGQIDWPAFFARLDRDGYEGWVSAEYFPVNTTEEGLGWLPRP